MPSHAALAQCAPPAGAGSPASGTTVTCSGTTTNANPPNGYGDGSQNGLTINVLSGATVTSNIQNGAGIAVNTGNTINNSGTISATGATNPPFATSNFGISAIGATTVLNNSTGTISGNSGSISVNGDLSLNNMGTVLSTASANGTFTLTNSGNTAELLSSTKIILTNTGNVVGTGNGNQVVGAPAGTINNSGLIDSPVATVGFGTIAILGKDQTFAITNSGTISFSQPTRNGSTGDAIGGTSDSLGDGSGNTITITNTASGKITSAADRAIFAISTTDNVGNKFNGNTLNITNAGTISANAGAFAIVNVGQNAVTNVVNSGTITGGGGIFTQNFTSTQFVPTFLTSGSSTVFNSGTITGTGGTAISFGGSLNTLTIAPTSIINGNVLGSGTDIFQLGGSGAGSFNASLIGAGQQYSGFATFNKIGDSTWTLTGAGTYTVPTNINAGILSVDGSLVSTVNVNSGGTLMGNGAIGGLNVASGGIVAPGHSIGQINVNGNATFGAGSTYQVEVNAAGQSDKIVATGKATLGGTVQVLAASGNYAPSTSYTFLTAAGGISGTFSGVTTNFAFLAPSLTYDPTDVVLTLVRNASFFSSVAQTFNQRSVAGALDASPFGSSLVQAVVLLTTPQALAAFDSLFGEVHPSTASMLLDESLYARSAVLGRLRQASYGGDAGMASLSAGGPTAFANGEELSVLSYAKSPIVTKAPPMASQPGYDVVFWTQGFGAWGRFDTDGNAAAVRRDLAGFFTGVDTRVGTNGRLGIAAGYTGSRNELDGRGGSTVETGHIAGYGGWSFGGLNLRGGGDFAFHTIDTSRMAVFPGFFDTDTAHYNGSTGQIFGEAGYGFAFGKVAVEPFAGAAWVRLQTDAFNERGGAAALTVAANSFEVGYSTLGIRAASMIPLAADMMLVPRVSAAWQHAFDNVTPTDTMAFQSTGVSFVIAGVPIARDALLAEAGLDLAIGRHATIGISYVGQIANNVQDHAAKGKFSWKF